MTLAGAGRRRRRRSCRTMTKVTAAHSTATADRCLGHQKAAVEHERGRVGLEKRSGSLLVRACERLTSAPVTSGDGGLREAAGQKTRPDAGKEKIDLRLASAAQGDNQDGWYRSM